MKTHAMLPLFAMALLAASAATADEPVRYYLVLDKAAISGGDPSNTRELVLDLEQRGEVWGPVFGISRNWNMATHRGAVRTATIGEGQIELDLLVDYTPDSYVKAAQGTYTVRLDRADGVLTGTFEGTFDDMPVKGKAWGWAFGSAPLGKDFVPLKPQEHPRILFRKSDLPALREKARTPLGQAAMKMMERSVTGMGVLYQLTGEKAWADRALAEARLVLTRDKSYDWYGTGAFTPKRPLGGRIEQLAMAYDLCYDAWPEDFKAQVRSWLIDMCYSVYFAPESLGTTNWNVQSNHVGIVYAGLGMAGLALFDEPSAEPAEPAKPFTDIDLPPAQDFTPPEGAPVVDFVPGKSPTDWLLTQRLTQVTPDDPRLKFYGLETVHPRPGTKVKVGEYELTFQRITDDRKSKESFGGIHIGDWLQSGKRSKDPLTLVFYTVLKVDKPGLYKLANPSSRGNLAQVAVSGRLLANGQVVRLQKGLYPMMGMIQFRIRWGEVAPHFVQATEKDLEEFKPIAADLEQKYQAQRLNYVSEHQLWKQSGGANPACQRLFRLGRWYMFLMSRYAVGTGGYQAEVAHYNYDTTDGLCRYAPAYRRMFGHEVSPFDDITHYVPRKIVGGPQDINGTNAIGYAYFASLLPIVPEKWQPEVLAAWNSQADVTSPKEAGKVLERDGVQGFLNYPLDMKPVAVGTNLPQTWHAPDSGYFAGRSGWDPKAYIAQVFLKSMPIHGWNGPNAGTFRLMGGGQIWAAGPTDRQRTRFQENVVWLPEDETNEGGLGRMTHYESSADGSFVVSVDLNDLYVAKGSHAWSKYGLVRLPGGNRDAPDPGIRAMRSIAVDYSGDSGSPCLLVVVDKITGGGRKLWLWQTPGPPEESVTPEDGGFTIRGAGDATLRGRFIAPGKVDVNAKSRTEEFTKAAGHGAGTTKFTVQINAINVSGGDAFYFVATVGDKHPEIKVEGKGLDAVVTVGKQTIRFDGKKIVLGK